MSSDPRENRPRRRILIVGVPWNTYDISFALEDALAANVRLCFVDIADSLEQLPASDAIDLLAVETLSASVIAAEAADMRFDAVLSITELTTVLAAEVRAMLGIPGTSPAVERVVTDKPATRACLRDAGLSTVLHTEADLSDVRGLAEFITYPAVFKPRAFTGSHGVRLLRNDSDLYDAALNFDVEAAHLAKRAGVVIETYVPGPEYSAEAFVVDGEVFLLAMQEKFNTGAPQFVETGHIMPSPSELSEMEAVHRFLTAATAAIGIQTSAIHAELKILPSGAVELIEMHTRFGGDRTVPLLSLTAGLRAYGLYFKAALGERPDLPALPPPPHVFWGVAFFGGRVGGRAHWSWWDFPIPDAVSLIDFDQARLPRVTMHEGVRLEYWRTGYAYFASESYEEVKANVSYMGQHFSQSYNHGADGTER